jgi:signal transduction histidine kinase
VNLRVLAAAVAALGLGLAAEAVAFRWDEPHLWVPDLTVGLAFIVAGLLRRQRPGRSMVAALLAATGVCWFLGNFSPQLLFLHRGPLIHLMLIYPEVRPSTRRQVVAVGIAYLATVVPAVWHSDVLTLVLGGVLLATVVVDLAAAGSARERRVAVRTRAALGLVLAGGAAVRLTFPADPTLEYTLIAYQVVLIAIALGLGLGARGPAQAALTDLVVEMGEDRSGTLRDRLARALGDPDLQVGYWSPSRAAFVDEQGWVLTLPPASGRVVTTVEREGKEFAVVVHDAALLRDPALADAVAVATRLTASQVALQAEARQRADELVASRRRLLVAADDERRDLERRFRDGPQRRLTGLARTLTEVNAVGNEHLRRSRILLDGTIDDLRELARGLHPRELVDKGLAPALAGLAQGLPVPVRLELEVARLPRDVEVTVYFLCAEALANVVKYAQASHVSISAVARDGMVTVVVTDNGAGGADPRRGSGLQGLADRVAALGGQLSVTSPPEAGTRLAAEIPLEGRGE